MKYLGIALIVLAIGCRRDPAVKESLTTEIRSQTAVAPSASVLRIDSANLFTQKVYLRWSKSTNALGYKVFIRYAYETIWYEHASVTDTAYTYDNLPMNEYYDFYVAAYDGYGNQTTSNIVRQPQLFFPPTITCNLTGKVKGVTYYLNWTTTVTPSYFTIKYSQVQYYQGGLWIDIYTKYSPSLTGAYSITLAKKMTVPWRILVMTDYGDWNVSNVVILSS